MNFKELLLSTKEGDEYATAHIINMYKPLLLKESVIDGVFDEDMHQELCLTLLTCVRKIKI